MADLSSSPRKPFHERVVELETELYKLFSESFYPEQSERERLANAFGIDEKVIQVWFQKKHAEWPDLGDDAVLKGVAVGSPEAEGFSRRKILRLAQDCVLEEAFIKDPNLITSDSAALARQLNVDQLVVALWLADKRAEAAKPKPKEKFDLMCFPVEVQQAQIKARGDKKFTAEQEAALKEIYKLIPNPDGYVLITKIAKKLNLPYVFTERWFEVQRLRERRTTRKTCGQLMAEYEAEIWIAGEEIYLNKGEDFEDKDFDRMAYDEGQRLGLEYYFKTMQHPDVLMREEIGEKLKLCPLLVKAWFVEKRACERLKAFETLQNAEWTMPPGPIFNHDDVELTIDHYFSAEAEKGLKELFKQKQFITAKERAAVAEQLGLTQFHTELWFEQERRNDRKARENAKQGPAAVAVPGTAEPVASAQVPTEKTPDIPPTQVPKPIDPKTRRYGFAQLASTLVKHPENVLNLLVRDAQACEQNLAARTKDSADYYTLATQETKLNGVAEYAIVKSIEFTLDPEASLPLPHKMRTEMYGQILKAMFRDQAEFRRKILGEAQRLEHGICDQAKGDLVDYQQRVSNLRRAMSTDGEKEDDALLLSKKFPGNSELAKELTECVQSLRQATRQHDGLKQYIISLTKMGEVSKEGEKPKDAKVNEVPKDKPPVEELMTLKISEGKNKEMPLPNSGSAHSEDDEDEDEDEDEIEPEEWAQKQANEAQKCLDQAESLYRAGSKVAALQANERGLKLCQMIAATEKQLLTQLGRLKD